MLQANPNLTPNLVKAIIQYTAQDMHYDALTQGAGFLNTKGAVDLARYLKRAGGGLSAIRRARPGARRSSGATAS